MVSCLESVSEKTLNILDFLSLNCLKGFWIIYYFLYGKSHLKRLWIFYCVSFWNSNLKRLWTFLFTLFEFLSEKTLDFLCFLCLEFLTKKTLKILGQIPVWKIPLRKSDFERGRGASLNRVVGVRPSGGGLL